MKPSTISAMVAGVHAGRMTAVLFISVPFSRLRGPRLGRFVFSDGKRGARVQERGPDFAYGADAGDQALERGHDHVEILRARQPVVAVADQDSVTSSAGRCSTSFIACCQGTSGSAMPCRMWTGQWVSIVPLRTALAAPS
jgi:hypothetical protein